MADQRAREPHELVINWDRKQGPKDMHLSPRNLSTGVRLSAPLLDSTMRRCAQPGSRRGRVTRAFLQPFPFELETLMSKSLSAVAIVALAILAAPSAQAQSSRPTMVSTTLSYESQQIANSAGASKMLRRIELAAQKLCTPISPVATPTSRQAMACRRATVAKAVAQLAAPMVTAAYDGKIELASR